MDYNFIYKEFQLMFPSIAEHAVSWDPINEIEIRIHLDDGMEMRYDRLSKCARRVIYHEDDDIDEKVWRREFARNIDRRMRQLGINQMILSERSGISQITISKYMNCSATPSTYNTRRLAKALECDYNDLIRVS